ncbi:MAG: hypothetical protein KID00_15850 [Clostridium argentinense]|uniref:Uncharacterized protein n=1 Tax=Clostridium faecium TaxID=2762223 RepID=A0ABR8YVX1_9CLOT|nr:MULTISPECIES: hypothetical protein [Clostridium]MBD8048422.1 hypothetical protein [Clostridium faecium]MBS5825291.1 hypothetical protein [Clostridium argentinense]MDU1350909.1 hypothetical protein [Clostridium argentinense]
MSEELKDFFVLYLRTLIIIIFMGIILPNILDYALNFITKDSTIYENSILVCKSIDKQRELLYNYIHIFKLFINF